MKTDKDLDEVSIMYALANIVRPIIRLLEWLAPVADLGIRIWAAKWFWDSGLTKIAVSGEFPFIDLAPFTIILFENEYAVPFLSPATAAYLGTAAELILPLLLFVGLFGRWAAIGLFVFNIVAVISYPSLNAIGQIQHLFYGTLLLLPMFRGPGKISIDHFFRKKYLEPL